MTCPTFFGQFDDYFELGRDRTFSGNHRQPYLVTGFPRLQGRSQRLITDLTQSIRATRNRIGHHHRIWAGDVDKNYLDLLTLAGFIDEDLREWISLRSTVSEVLAQRPQ